MDRLARPLLVCVLGLLFATGCRSTQPEVPPGRPYAKDGQQRKAIQFSSDGHPATAQGSAPYMPGNLGGSDIASGISGGARPSGAAYGGPEGGYGPPGSNGVPNPMSNLSDPATGRASSTSPGSIPLTGTPPDGLPPLGTANPSASNPPASNPPSTNLPDLNVTPPRENLPAPNQDLPAPLDKPGAMAAPDPMPGPN